MKHFLLSSLTLIVVYVSQAQDPAKRRYNATIKSAYHIHDTASVYRSSLHAAALLDKLSDEFPDEWLASYWSAYIYTQCGLYPDRPKNAGEIFPTNALKNIEQAIERYQGDSSQILSNLYSLKAFTLTNHTWYPEHQDKAGEFSQKAAQASKTALKYNPDNPMIYVLTGVSMLRSDEVNDIVAARATLYRARTLFKKVDEHPAFTMHWNENWLRFRWLKFADQRLLELVSEE